MDEEIWKPLVGYDYNYEISNLGRVKLVRTISKGSKDRAGYLRVMLIKNGKEITKKVHRLVCEAFLDTYSEELVVNHIDFNKSNNIVSNLECVTNYENSKHYYESVSHLTYSKTIGISFHKGCNRWQVRYKGFKLGSYTTIEEAKDVLNKYKNTKDSSMIIDINNYSLHNNKELIKDSLFLRRKGFKRKQIESVLNISETTLTNWYNKYSNLFLDYHTNKFDNLKMEEHKPNKVKSERIGKSFTNKESETYTIIDFNKDSNMCSIEFKGYEGKILTNLDYERVRRARIVSPFRITVKNKGYIGIGEYSPKDDKIAYNRWFTLLNNNLDEYFNNFQNFCRWFYLQSLNINSTKTEIIVNDKKLIMISKAFSISIKNRGINNEDIKRELIINNTKNFKEWILKNIKN